MRIVNGEEKYSLYEEASQNLGEKVPAPVCHFCHHETGYIEDDSPAAKLTLALMRSLGAQFGYFLYQDKVYVHIARCIFCEMKYRGASGHLDIREDGETRVPYRKEYLEPMLGLSPETNVKLNLAYQEAKIRFEAQFKKPEDTSRRAKLRQGLPSLGEI